VPLDDVKAHEKALLDLFLQYERNQLKPIPVEFAQKYNRLVLAGELARQFESLMDIDKNALLKVRERQL
jgi:hypothetical protein